MIDTRSEKLIRLVDVCNYIPSSRFGKTLSKGVVHRWAHKGEHGVVLESLKIGGGRITSLEAVQRFAERLNNAPVPRSRRRPHKIRTDQVTRALSKYGL